jgi:NAD(P)H-dependent FMN reductase
MQSASEYVIVSASLRSNSLSRMLAHYLKECYAAEGVEAQLIDLRDSPLPLCDGESAYDHPAVGPLSQLISDARVVTIATPIYNFDASAALKNLIELTGDAWENKVVGFLCAAGGTTSFMSIMSLANSLMLDFRCLIIPRIVYATRHDFADGEVTSAEVRQRVRQLAAVSIRTRNGHQLEGM